MKKEVLLILIFFGITAVFSQDRRPSPGVDGFAGSFEKESAAPVGKMTLWYRRPAANWNEALPIGNGRLGAMIFGGIEGERIQLNEDTLWGGSPYDPANPEAFAALAEARQLIFDSKYKEAEILIDAKMMSRPLKQMPYQTIGDLRLGFPKAEQVSDYRRELDIDRAVARVSYRIGETRYTREMFASAVSDVIVIRLTADKPGKVDLQTSFQSPQRSSVKTENGNTLVLSGVNGGFLGVEGKLRFESRATVSAVGGTVGTKCSEHTATSQPYSLVNSAVNATETERSLPTDGNCITVSKADSATITISAATAYKNYNDISGDAEAKAKKPLAAAVKQKYEKLLNEHVADHQKLFRRVELNLGTAAQSDLPTDERIKRFADSDDPQFAALYFQFGRYLLIASSRPGTQPANLQGIWNDSMSPPWNSKFTININTQMNYWPAEPTNLPETTEPLLKMVEDLAVTGSKMAKDHYQASGWVTHHNTDAWRASGPIDAARYGIWPTGGAWLTMHLWEHYEYAQDREYLKRIYPLLKGSAQFFVDTLVEDPKTKFLVTSPSTSPENRHPFGTSVTAGPMMDSQIIRDLFDNTIKAAELLGTDAEFRRILSEKKQRLAPNKVGKGGHLQEWLEDWDVEAPDQRHRHVSHLYGAFPSWQINVDETPDLVNGVKKTLDQRGDETTGWAIAWRLNLWARLRDAERAYKILALLIRPERTYPNMFDAHPPFQIDGNFGGTNGIAEMLVQNRVRDGVVEVEFLPALPAKFYTGSFKGVRVRHGATVDAEWKDGRLISAKIYSTLNRPFRLKYGKAVAEKTLAKGESFVFRP